MQVPNAMNDKQTSKAYEMIKQAMGSSHKEGVSNYANFSNIFSLSGPSKSKSFQQAVDSRKQ